MSSNEGYYLAGASYDSVNFSVSSQSSFMFDFGFADSGTKMYAQSSFNGGTIYQYALSTAYDISTASYASKSYSFANGESGFVITPDGSTLYISANTGDAVHKYTFGTAFDVSTLGSGTQVFSTSSVDTQPDKCRFNSNGSKFFLLGRANNRIYEYSVSTAYDLSTASYSNNSLLVSSQAAAPLGFDFSSDGTKLIVSDNTTDSVYLYNLSTGFDITTASYSGTNFSLASQDSVPGGVSFNPSGSKMFVLGNANNTVFQYSTALSTAQLDLSTGSVFDYTPTSDVQVTLSNPADSGTVSGATLLLSGGAGNTGYDIANASYSDTSFSVNSQLPESTGVAFNSVGTKMYVIGDANQSVFEYNLSTAYDVSTSSYNSVSFNVSGQDTSPTDVIFNNDGTKMYIAGYTSQALYQYSLSTAFDLSTASYDSVSFSVASQSSPSGFSFNDIGTKVYIVSFLSDLLYQYSLSTAFDLSTASYDSVSFSVASQETDPRGVQFNTDGTKMYVVGKANDTVFQYTLSTAFNLSTASYDSVSFSVASQDTDPRGVAFKSDGTKMYVIGNANGAVYQYSTATPATITYDTAIEWPSGTAPTSPAIGETDVVTFNTRDGGSTYQGVLAIDGAK